MGSQIKEVYLRAGPRRGDRFEGQVIHAVGKRGKREGRGERERE